VAEREKANAQKTYQWDENNQPAAIQYFQHHEDIISQISLDNMPQIRNIDTNLLGVAIDRLWVNMARILIDQGADLQAKSPKESKNVNEVIQTKKRELVDRYSDADFAEYPRSTRNMIEKELKNLLYIECAYGEKAIAPMIKANTLGQYKSGSDPSIDTYIKICKKTATYIVDHPDSFGQINIGNSLDHFVKQEQQWRTTLFGKFVTILKNVWNHMFPSGDISIKYGPTLITGLHDYVLPQKIEADKTTTPDHTAKQPAISKDPAGPTTVATTSSVKEVGTSRAQSNQV
jgi:hypothetical protein